MVGGRAGFLVAGLWEGVRGTIEKCFSTSFFMHVAVQCRFTSLLLLWRFCFFRVLGGLAHHKTRNIQKHGGRQKQDAEQSNRKYYDQIFEEIKELYEKKSEEALLLEQKKFDFWTSERKR